MSKEKVLFKKVSWSQKKPCHFCDQHARWKATINGNSVDCCGSKYCRKKAEKFVS